MEVLVRARHGRKNFFSEEKKQKTFIRLDAAFPERAATAGQTFFGSFFQKRTDCFTARRAPG
jgi:hypothetical protein